MRPLSRTKLGMDGWFSSPSVGERLMISLRRAEGWAVFGSIGMQRFAPTSCLPSDRSPPCILVLSQEKSLAIFSSPPLRSWVCMLDHFISGCRQDFVHRGFIMPNGQKEQAAVMQRGRRLVPGLLVAGISSEVLQM